jgi:outer membrane protein assembly factor BamE (lipoprotein component of BamABCDE complex)
MGTRTATIAAALAVFGLISGVGIYYLGRADEDRRPAPELIQQLAGVRLGMSPTDVTLSLGKPSASSTTEFGASGDAHLTYVYTKKHNTEYVLNVTFHGTDSLSTRAVVICEKGGFSNLLGFDKFSREEDVLRVLGTPIYSSVRSDGLERAISYDAWNASFKIAQGKVVAICIHQGNFIRYDKEDQTARHAPPG